MDEIEHRSAQRGAGHLALQDPSMLAVFRRCRRSTPTVRHGRVLLAGDAAHVQSPAGGQGLNTGLQDAFSLGWKLALVAHGACGPALLDSYQAERAPIAAGTLEFTHRLVRTFTIASPRQRWVRDRALSAAAIPPLRRRLTRRLAQLSLNYRGGPLSPPAHGAGRRSLTPGGRIPHVDGLQHRGRAVSTLDLITGEQHTLLVLTGKHAADTAISAATTQLSPFAEQLKVTTIVGAQRSSDPHAVIDPDLRAHRRYRALRGQLVLVRPDGYVACHAPLTRPDIPARYLRDLTRRSGERTSPPRPAAASTGGDAKRRQELTGVAPTECPVLAVTEQRANGNSASSESLHSPDDQWSPVSRRRHLRRDGDREPFGVAARTPCEGEEERSIPTEATSVDNLTHHPRERPTFAQCARVSDRRGRCPRSRAGAGAGLGGRRAVRVCDQRQRSAGQW
jgi:hypothetical protein